FPAAVREWMAECGGPLAVHASGYALPWELVHDGREFWAVRHAVGRLPEGRMAGAPPPSSHARLRALIVGTDPDGSLPFVDEEVEAVNHCLRPRCEVVSLVGSRVTLSAMHALLGERWDIIHLCGTAADGLLGGVDIQ